MRCDPALLEIVRNHFSAMCASMCHVVERTSYSSYVTESADYACGLVAPDGSFFAYPKGTGITIFMGLTLARAIEECGGEESMRPGDVIVTNDPYATDGLSTHLPDIHVFKPVFAEGRLVCYAWSFIHAGDVGGSVPTSLTPFATDIQMEGLRIPPVRLYRAGELVDDVRRIIVAASRMPDLLLGDLNCMVAAVNTGEAKVAAACEKFGAQTVRDAAADLVELAEARARAVVARIPDGTYAFEDYLDDDAATDVPVRLAVDLTVAGEELVLDFTRSDPQVATAFNLITNGSHHPYLYQGIVNYIVSADPFIPINGGLTRPVRIVAPEGTVVNAAWPAAGGLRHPTSMRLYNTVLGALAQAVPQILQAAGGGQACIVTLSVPDEARGGAWSANVVEPMSGGDGGRLGCDGVDGIDHAAGFLRNTPVEMVERRSPVRVLRYELVPDTAGAGEYRGGCAIELAFEPLADRGLVGARGQDRSRFAPWGLAGGEAGSVGGVRVLRGATGEEERYGKVGMLEVAAGDVVSVRMPSGGGWGDPLERDPERVRADVAAGLVGERAAREVYGVVLARGQGGPEVDAEATRHARAELRTGRPAGDASLYDLGADRRAYEGRWTPEASDELARLAQTVPVARRARRKEQVHERLDAAGGPVRARDVRAVWDDVEGARDAVR